LHLSHITRALILLAVLSAGSAWASGGPPMITDDPGTPGDGHWEINAAGLCSHAVGATAYQLPLVDVNYGVGDRLQLKFEIPWLLQNGITGASRSGAGDGLAGIKWRFYDAGENAWQISTYPQVEFGFPLSNSTHNGLVNSSINYLLPDSGTSYLLPVELEHGFEGFDVNFELGRWFRPAHQGDTWIAGGVLTHEVRKGFELMVELHDESVINQSQDELILNFGARWDFSKQYTLLLSAGHDVHNTLGNTNTLLTYIGLQMRY
jgi:hypothetical protein